MRVIPYTKSFTVRKNKFILLPQKAVFYEEKKLLIITDPHFGKSTAFRKAGLAVPDNYQSNDLNVLNYLIKELEVKLLIILGDFFHTRSGVTSKLNNDLYRWRKENLKTEIILVKGNHDKSSGEPERRLKIKSTTQYVLDKKFLFTHKEKKESGYYNFSGHIHPSIKVKLFGNQKVILPCFYFTKESALLPSFGTFTGTYQIKPEEGSKIFVIADEKVIKL